MEKEGNVQKNKEMKKKTFLKITLYFLTILFGVIYFHVYRESKIVNEVTIQQKNIDLNGDNKDISMEKNTFYALNKENTALIKKSIKMPKIEKKRDKIEAMLKFTFENLVETGVLTSQDIEIKNIFIKNGDIFINCGSGLLELNSENKKNLLAIYSIVNTLTEIEGVKSVKFFVNNAEQKGIFSKSYTRNDKI